MLHCQDDLPEIFRQNFTFSAFTSLYFSSWWFFLFLCQIFIDKFIKKITSFNLPDAICLSQTTDEECSICLQSMMPGDLVRLLNCRHQFHDHCLMPWLIIQSRCPYCLKGVRLGNDRLTVVSILTFFISTWMSTF